MKKRSKAAVGLLAVALVAAWLYVSRLDRSIIDGVERAGREAFGTDVVLEAVDVSLGDRQATLRGLRVANVEGFDAPLALSIDSIALDIDLDTFAGDVVRLDEVLVEDGDLFAEERGGALNLATLLERVRRAEAGERETEPGPRLAIERFRISGARVHVESERLDGEGVLELPPIVVEDVGTASRGVTYGEAAEALLAPVLAAARSAFRERAGKALSDAAKREIEDAVREELEAPRGE